MHSFQKHDRKYQIQAHDIQAKDTCKASKSLDIYFRLGYAEILQSNT